MTVSLELPITRFLSERYTGDCLIPLASLFPWIPGHRIAAITLSVEPHLAQSSLTLLREGADIGTHPTSKQVFEWAASMPARLKTPYPAQLAIRTRGDLTIRLLRASYVADEEGDTTRTLMLPIHRKLQGLRSLTNAATFRDFPGDAKLMLTRMKLRGRSAEGSRCVLVLGGTFHPFRLVPDPEERTVTFERPLPLSSLEQVHVQAPKAVIIQSLELSISGASALPGLPELSTLAWQNRYLARQLLTRAYDPDQPLFFLHAQRCGGTTLKSILREWFGDRYHEHYPPKGNLPGPRVRLSGGSAMGGHFSRQGGSAIEELYPDARQMITMLRDPYDIAVSRYHYLEEVQKRGSLKRELERCLAERDSLFFDYLPKKDAGQRMEDYLREKFLYAGLFECLPESVRLLSILLGKEQPLLPELNASRRPAERTPDLRAEFRRVFREEYELYDLVTERHLRAGISLARAPKVPVLRKQGREVGPSNRVVL